MTDSIGVGRAVQAKLYRDGVYGRRPPVPVSAAALEAAASRRMTPQARAYVVGSAGLEDTARANRAAFDRWRIVPRMLRDVSVRDTSVELFGRRYPSPFLTAPVGVLGMVHPKGDVAVAKAAAELGVPMIFSNQASYPMERCAAAMGDAARWFQLYWSSSDELVASFVRRAEAIGCGAVVVTLDTHMLGWRPRDLDAAYLPFARGLGIAQYTSDPVFGALVKHRAAQARTADQRPTYSAVKALASMARAYPGGFWENLRSPLPRAAVDTFLDVFSRSNLTWDNLSYLREHTSLPILLKGVLHPDDAAQALVAGVDGIVVSNHGGRQVDGSIAALDALPGVVEAVAGRVPVLFDSGIRGAADAFKAIALGATAVCVGRPYVYGLALAGQRGVETVLGHLMAEFDLTMGLTGCAAVSDITRDTLRRAD
jgi:isopentenyl diphosphate isomerase/L-lactate dehydrogenase-like FMN-dependent dehydrogenase